MEPYSVRYYSLTSDFEYASFSHTHNFDFFAQLSLGHVAFDWVCKSLFVGPHRSDDVVSPAFLRSMTSYGIACMTHSNIV